MAPSFLAYAFLAFEIKCPKVVSPFMQNMMALHPDRCALVYYWRGHGTKYTVIIFKKQAIRKMGFPVLRTTAEIADAASNSDNLFVNSSQMYFLFTEIVPFFSHCRQFLTYICVFHTNGWPCVESPPQPCGESGRRRFPISVPSCSWESSSWLFKLKL